MEAPTIQLTMHTRLSRSTCIAMPPWYLMAMMVARVRGTMCINFEREPRLQTKLTYQIKQNSSKRKDAFLSNGMNKHAPIQLISGRLREKGCHTIQAEGDADLDSSRHNVSVQIDSPKNLTCLSCCSVMQQRMTARTFAFGQNKDKPNVYNITVLTYLLGDDVCSDLLFIHAFSGCDTTSRIFGVGKKVIAGDSVLHECSMMCCTSGATLQVITKTATTC